jgi:aldose 1-epimerase
VEPVYREPDVLPRSTMTQAFVKKMHWGDIAGGEPVELYILGSPALTVRVTTYGARVTGVEAPDRHGNRADVVLGYKSLRDYEADDETYFGAVVGRYGNRIAHGAFSLDGKTYHIPPNDGANALHGGPIGFDRKVWEATQLTNGVEMTLVSADGDMGFPGRLTAEVRYTLERHALRIVYRLTTNAPTVVNLTNHSYFNLAGEANGTILNQKLMINADRYTPVDEGLIPTGEIASVLGTPFDFRTMTAIGARINESDEQLERVRGYDHNFVLNGKAGAEPRLAARAFDPGSRRTLTVLTTEPGVQFYSGNSLAGATTGISGTKYEKNAGFCLETQHYPDSPNHPRFPSTVLRRGQTLHSQTLLMFGVREQEK